MSLLFGWRTRVITTGYRDECRVQVYDRPWWRLFGKAKWRSLSPYYRTAGAALVVADQVADEGPYAANLRPELIALQRYNGK